MRAMDFDIRTEQLSGEHDVISLAEHVAHGLAGSEPASS